MAKKRSRLRNSGKTQLSIAEAKQTFKMKAGLASRAPGSALQTAFGRITPDAAPGWNTLNITGLPAGTRVISVWMTEWIQGNLSHAGGAWYLTDSVQLFDGGRQCRVRYFQSWNTHLPTGVMAIFGPG